MISDTKIKYLNTLGAIIDYIKDGQEENILVDTCKSVVSREQEEKISATNSKETCNIHSDFFPFLTKRKHNYINSINSE